MPICFVKWSASFEKHEGAVVGWVTKGGNLDGRVWAVIMENGKFVDVVASKLEFVRWP